MNACKAPPSSECAKLRPWEFWLHIQPEVKGSTSLVPCPTLPMWLGNQLCTKGPTEGWVKGSPTACSTVIVGRCAMWAGIPPSMPDNTGLAWELGMRVVDRSRVLVRRSKQIGQGRLVGKDIFKLCSAFLHIFKSQYPVFQKILLLKTNPFQNRSQSHFKLLDFAQFLIYLNYRWF